MASCVLKNGMQSILGGMNEWEWYKWVASYAPKMVLEYPWRRENMETVQVKMGDRKGGKN